MLVWIIVLVVAYLIYTQLNKSNNKKLSSVVLFYRPGCPWCDIFKPEWEIIEKQLRGKAIKVNTASESANLESKKYKVEGVPSIVLVDTSGNYEHYTGDRKAAAILEHIKGRI
jgi:thioredoxin-related protein